MTEARTEEPTARKLAEARRRGQVAVSPVLSGALAALALLAALSWNASALLAAAERLLRTALQAPSFATTRSAFASLREPLGDLAWALLPVLLAPCAAAWLAGFVQIGPLFATGALSPAWSRIDPRSRLRELWSIEHMLEVGYAALAACALLGLLAWSLIAAAPALFALPRGDVARAWSVLATLATNIVLRMAVAAMLFGTIDLVLRRVRARRALRMTRRELGAELRESHGLPEHRARRLRAARELHALAALGGAASEQDARLLLLDRSGRAIAIALAAQDGGARAPRLLAKGQGALALRMRAAAAESDLPVRDHDALVSSLFRLEQGEGVPAEHFAVLAELFADAGVS